MSGFNTIALIPAAGMGKRMGATINKQYLMLKDMPIVARTISFFDESPSIDAIYLVIPAEEIAYCRKHIVEKYGFKKVKAIVPGGTERQHSVMNALEAMREHVSDGDIVLIHDGVRPLITNHILHDSINTACLNDGALVAVPVKDTIKTVHDGFASGTPLRESLWQAQTPQTFRFETIFRAHLAAKSDGFLGTDDASLVERIGGKVRIVQGDYRNIKITTPEDLILAESFLAEIEGDVTNVSKNVD
jgi:2-C-methyl-D-erythritol 4-phosphate cytidylyltransferase